MVTGAVHGLRILIGVTFRIRDRQDLTIECVLDSGFEGAIALQAEAVYALGLPFFQEIGASLADNTRVAVDAHRATIRWQGEAIDIAVLSMGKVPLIGTALLAGSRLIAEFVDGGLVTIEAV